MWVSNPSPHLFPPFFFGTFHLRSFFDTLPHAFCLATSCHIGGSGEGWLRPNASARVKLKESLEKGAERDLAVWKNIGCWMKHNNKTKTVWNGFCVVCFVLLCILLFCFGLVCFVLFFLFSFGFFCFFFVFLWFLLFFFVFFWFLLFFFVFFWFLLFFFVFFWFLLFSLVFFWFSFGFFCFLLFSFVCLFVCLLVTVFAWMVMVRGAFSGLAKRILDYFSFFCLNESLENNTCIFVSQWEIAPSKKNIFKASREARRIYTKRLKYPESISPMKIYGKPTKWPILCFWCRKSIG